MLYQYNSIYFLLSFISVLFIDLFHPSEPLLAVSFPPSVTKLHSFALWAISVAFTHLLPLLILICFSMRSSAILVAALVGVASAGMPKWPLQWSKTASGGYGGGVGSTGKPHLGPGPVSEMPHTGGSFPTTYPKDHHPKKEHHNSGGMFPSGGSSPTTYPKDHHPKKEHHSSGGMFPSGGPTQHRPEKHHHKPTGSGVGPTGTGHGGSPPLTSGPLTTTITKTSDVTSKTFIGQVLLTRTNIHNRHNDFHTLRHYHPDFYNH